MRIFSPSSREGNGSNTRAQKEKNVKRFVFIICFMYCYCVYNYMYFVSFPARGDKHSQNVEQTPNVREEENITNSRQEYSVIDEIGLCYYFNFLIY